MNLIRNIRKGFFIILLISICALIAGVSVAQEIPSFEPSLYSLPHYGTPREGVLFPEKKITVTIKRPIQMGQCAPCHENLDGFRKGWLKNVNHNLHFTRGISCDTCHFENPHYPDHIVRIPMKVCFNCHGLTHGPTGPLAPGECNTCHPKRAEPPTHTIRWKLKEHASADTHECVMCHRDISFCNKCHLKESVRNIEELEYNFKPMRITGQTLISVINIKLPTTMSDCYPCHKDIEKINVPGLIFNHEKHFAKGIKCQSCHDFYPHQPDRTLRIPMQSCYSCHQLIHGKQGLLASGDCSLCHPRGFNLKPKDHTGAFVKGVHKDRAYKEPSYCSMCHADSFCQRCHLQKKIMPADHKDVANFRPNHGKDYIKRKYCFYCHIEKFCTDCHRVDPIPHPPLFLADHGKIKYADKSACNVCHKDRTMCENCHHFQVARALLKRENCIRCHPEYRLKMLQIKNRGHMVHAAHFEMTNTPPFTCDKCHAQGYALGHDYATFQLCKECHGAYRLGKLIAKWNVDNGELCARCHRVGSGLPENVRVTPP